MGEQQPDRDEHRRAPRSNLFLAATIEADGVSAQVRIRNLSETGALIEGPAFPPAGTIVTLRRQEVEISGEIVWVAVPRCGIRFQGSIGVSEWISGKRAPLNFAQARVDAVQAAIRSGTPMPQGAATPARLDALAAGLDDRLAKEISYVQHLLDELSTELIQNPVVVQQHDRKLQNFDIADQILGHLAKVLAAPDREAAIKAIGMEDLRARLTRKPL